MKHKNILKEAGVLLIVAILVLTAIVVFTPITMVTKAQPTEFFFEDFETGLPGTWNVNDLGTPGTYPAPPYPPLTWVDTNPGARTPTGGCAGTFMIADSDLAGWGGIVMYEELISPPFSCVGGSNILLEFAHYYCDLDSIASVDIRHDGGLWQNVETYTATTTGPSIIDITGYLPSTGSFDVQIRFVYDDTGEWGWYWMIDNVKVYEAPPPCNIQIGNIYIGIGPGNDKEKIYADIINTGGATTITYTMTFTFSSGYIQTHGIFGAGWTTHTTSPLVITNSISIGTGTLPIWVRVRGTACFELTVEADCAHPKTVHGCAGLAICS